MNPSQAQNPTNQTVVKSLHSDGPHANPNNSKQASASTAQPINASAESGSYIIQSKLRKTQRVIINDLV